MKCLCIRQPYASGIALGIKNIEARSWQTDYRGPVLLCTSKTIEEKYAELVKGNAELYPTGAAIGVATLCDCAPLRESMFDDAFLPSDFGTEGMYALEFKGFLRFKEPCPAELPETECLYDADLPAGAAEQLEGTPYGGIE